MSRRRALLLQAAAGGGPTFFGNYSMLREYWAEDPDWTNPGNGNTLLAIRDNGSIASDLSIVSFAGGLAPIYTSSLVGGRPGFEFLASSPSSGGYARSDTGANGTDLTVGCVARFDNGNANIEYAIDGDSTAADRTIIGTLTGTGGWRGYSTTSLNVAAGTVDTDPHLFLYRSVNGDARLYVDGTLVGSDAVGTVGDFSGVVLGAAQGKSVQALNGAICYAFMFAGDLTAQAGFAAWEADIMTYYGI